METDEGTDTERGALVESDRKDDAPAPGPVDDSSRDSAKGQGEERKATVVGVRKEDGTIELRFDAAGLEVRADFFPPAADGQALTPDYLSSVFERMGLAYGVDWDAVQEAALSCNLDRRPVKDVLIAKGDLPVEEVTEYFEVDPSFRQWPRLPDGDVPRIDYRELSPFVVVRKDQVLARQRPRVAGREGRDVHGNVVPAPSRKPESAKPGPNTRIEGNAILATCAGRLVENGKELAVEEVLVVKGEVGYKTGHIVFPGDVYIDGNVADGFKIYAGGSLVSKQSMDATDVVVKKDLVVAGGLIGRGRASIKAGGTLRAKFIQNCHVACRGDVMAASAVVNSQIYTLKALDLGDKGRIVGGEIFAVRGVRAAAIGHETSRNAKIHCGVDFTVQQEIDRRNELLRVGNYKLSRLRDKIKAEGAGSLLNGTPLSAIEKKLEEELSRVGFEIADLLGKLDAFDEAVVEVSGEVARGTLIEICHVALFVEEPVKKSRFRLDKAQGRIVRE